MTEFSSIGTCKCLNIVETVAVFSGFIDEFIVAMIRT
jgi:hypothetical protein